jgi:hypothetical protein
VRHVTTSSHKRAVFSTTALWPYYTRVFGARPIFAIPVFFYEYTRQIYHGFQPCPADIERQEAWVALLLPLPQLEAAHVPARAVKAILHVDNAHPEPDPAGDDCATLDETTEATRSDLLRMLTALQWRPVT